MTDDELTRIAALQESGYPGEDREVAWIEALTDARALRAEVDRLRAENAAMRVALRDCRLDSDGNNVKCPHCREMTGTMLAKPDPHAPDCPFVWYGENADD